MELVEEGRAAAAAGRLNGGCYNDLAVTNLVQWTSNGESSLHLFAYEVCTPSNDDEHRRYWLWRVWWCGKEVAVVVAVDGSSGGGGGGGGGGGAAVVVAREDAEELVSRKRRRRRWWWWWRRWWQAVAVAGVVVDIAFWRRSWRQ